MGNLTIRIITYSQLSDSWQWKFVQCRRGNNLESSLTSSAQDLQDTQSQWGFVLRGLGGCVLFVGLLHFGWGFLLVLVVFLFVCFLLKAHPRSLI